MSALDMAPVERALAGTRFSGRLHYIPSVGSTNSIALEAAQAGAREGVWIADEQTSGRGRGGHAWHSSAGDGLYVSALVTPRTSTARAMWISLATGLAARTAIAEAAGLSVDIRWPNDLLLGDRKCGGILVESAISAALPAANGDSLDTLRYAVIGIGINVNHSSFPEDLRRVATSLRMAAGREIVREELLSALLLGLDRELARLDEEQSLPLDENGLLRRFSAASSWVQGKRVRVGEADSYTGITAGLSPEGFLLVDADDGTRRTVLSGGVRELRE